MTKYALLYSSHFEDDFKKALIFYDRISTEIGDKFQTAFYSAEERLLQNPLTFSFFKRYKIQTDTFKKFPFKIIYQIKGETIYVLALTHTARSNRFIKRRLKIK